MSVWNEYGRNSIDRVCCEYDQKRINGYITNARQDIEQIRAYIWSCEKQLDIIKGIEYNKTVTVRKGKSYFGHVEYRVDLIVVPVIGNTEYRDGAWTEISEEYPATPNSHDLDGMPGRAIALERATWLQSQHLAARIIRFQPTKKEMDKYNIYDSEIKL